MDDIILVNEQDEGIGTGEKMPVHKEGKLHRAFSIFVFNNKGEVLLQRRSLEKYHSPGLWSNACCGHPKPGEEIIEAAHRRLKEEMGFDTKLQEQFSFIYKVKLGEFFEHECDHVLTGKYSGEEVNTDPAEVAEYKWISWEALNKDIEKNPAIYTFWLKVALDEFSKRKINILD